MPTRKDVAGVTAMVHKLIRDRTDYTLNNLKSEQIIKMKVGLVELAKSRIFCSHGVNLKQIKGDSDKSQNKV